MKIVILGMLVASSLMAAGNTDVKSFIEDLKAVSSALKTEAAPIDSSTDVMKKIQTINNQASVVQATKRLNESSPEFSNATYKKQIEINVKSLSSLTESIPSVAFIPSSGFYEVDGNKFSTVDQYVLNSQIQTITTNANKKRDIILLVSRLNKLAGYKEIDFVQYKSELDSVNTKITNMLEQAFTPSIMVNNIATTIQGGNITLKSNAPLSDKIKVLEISDTYVKIGLL